jgi:hypothetical protein
LQVTYFLLYSPAGWPDLADLLVQLSTASGKAAGQRRATVAAGKLPNGLLEWSRGAWKLAVKSPVLVFGTRHSPATPYQATGPYADMYPDARLVTLNGWGHTTVGKSACADATIRAYLVNLAAPRDGADSDSDVATGARGC